MHSLQTYWERLLAAIPFFKRWRRSLFYDSHLRSLEQALEAHPSRQMHFSVQSLTLDGRQVLSDTEVLVGGTLLDATTFVYLFSVFNGSDCLSEETNTTGDDGAPPGSYICISNSAVIGAGHENRIGLYQHGRHTDLSIDAVHIDHIFLAPHMRGSGLGGIMFGLCALAAFSIGVDRITLLAAGGQGFKSIYYGYRIWPRYGFDAPLNSHELSLPQFANCSTVQDLLMIDPAWWETHGGQREMDFDLTPHSRSWKILLDYARNIP